MRSRRALPWLVAATAALWALLGTFVQYRAGRSLSHLLSELLAGLVLVAAALAIWRRRADNRCWWLLMGAAFAWYVGTFVRIPHAGVADTAFALTGWQAVLLAWALLAYPRGRITAGRDRGLLLVLVGLFSVRSLARLLLHVPPDVAGFGTRNRFLPVTSDRPWRAVEAFFDVAYPAVVLLVLLSVVGRWVSSSGPGRRMLSPGLVAAGAMLLAVAAEQSRGWNLRVAGDRVPVYLVRYWAAAAVAAALAYGLVRLRETRSAVVDLVAELGHDVPPVRLGEVLRRALDDPGLELLTWSGTDGGYVDADGERAELPDGRHGRAVTLVERRGEPLVALVHDVALMEDPGLVNAVAAAVRLTVDNEWLQAETQAQLAEVAASRSRILAAGDEERRRIERDLHDGAQQRLVAVALALRLAETQPGGDAGAQTRALLSKAVSDLGAAIDELRDLARGVHPAILTESGLCAALESLADRFPLPVRLDLDVPQEPDTTAATAAYFAAAEALTNIGKHSGASAASVTASVVDSQLRLVISDNGQGCADASGSGLSGISDRLAAGGSLHVHSSPGTGTRVEVEVPCASS